MYLFQFFLFMAFVLSLFVPQLSFILDLGKVVLHDSGISSVTPLIFFCFLMIIESIPGFLTFI